MLNANVIPFGQDVCASISVDFATYAVFLPHAAANSSLLSVANLANVPTVEPFVSPAKYSLTWRANFVGKQSSVLASAKSLLSIKFKFTYLHIQIAVNSHCLPRLQVWKTLKGGAKLEGLLCHRSKFRRKLENYLGNFWQQTMWKR